MFSNKFFLILFFISAQAVTGKIFNFTCHRKLIKDCLELITAFIFDWDDDDSATLMNHKYDDKCSQNETVMITVNEFTRNFDKIKIFLSREVRLIRRQGFRTVSSEICESKRNIARTMTDCIQPIMDFCVGDEKARKKLVLNTLLLLETALDFICGLNESHFDDIYEWQSQRCLTDNMQLLQLCRKKSYDLYFWERVPEKLPSLVKLINGQVCK
jgi:hypothetical protein